jgi:RAP domain
MLSRATFRLKSKAARVKNVAAAQEALRLEGAAAALAVKNQPVARPHQKVFSSIPKVKILKNLAMTFADDPAPVLQKSLDLAKEIIDSDAVSGSDLRQIGFCLKMLFKNSRDLSKAHEILHLLCETLPSKSMTRFDSIDLVESLKSLKFPVPDTLKSTSDTVKHRNPVLNKPAMKYHFSNDPTTIIALLNNLNTSDPQAVQCFAQNIRKSVKEGYLKKSDEVVKSALTKFKQFLLNPLEISLEIPRKPTHSRIYVEVLRTFASLKSDSRPERDLFRRACEQFLSWSKIPTDPIGIRVTGDFLYSLSRLRCRDMTTDVLKAVTNAVKAELQENSTARSQKQGGLLDFSEELNTSHLHHHLNKSSTSSNSLKFRSSDIANICQGLGRLGAWSDELGEILIDPILNKIQEHTFYDLACVIWGYAISNVDVSNPKIESLVTEVAKEFQRRQVPGVVSDPSSCISSKQSKDHWIILWSLNTLLDGLPKQFSFTREQFTANEASALIENSSEAHRDISKRLGVLNIHHINEYEIEASGSGAGGSESEGVKGPTKICVDIALPEKKIVVEADGPWHFVLLQDGSQRYDGATAWKKRMIRRNGWSVVDIPTKVWESCRNKDSYLVEKISC